MNAENLLIYAFGGFLVGYVGTFLISYSRSPKLLDDDRARDVDNLSKLNEGLKCNLESVSSAPLVGQLDQKRRTIVSEKMRQFLDGEKVVIQHIHHHGKMSRSQLAGLFNLTVADEATRKGMEHGLLNKEKNLYEYCISPDFSTALDFYFNDEQTKANN